MNRSSWLSYLRERLALPNILKAALPPPRRLHSSFICFAGRSSHYTRRDRLLRSGIATEATASTNHAALPAAQTFSCLAGWTNTRRTCLVRASISTEATASTNCAAVFSVRSCSCIVGCTTCLLTDGQLIEAVLNAAGPRLQFAVN